MKNEQDALDVIQDSVCKGYVALKKVKEKKYLKTWFTKIIINAAIDLLNKNKKVISIPNTDHFDRSYENKGIESKLDLYEALDVLRHQERTIIVLRYFEDQKLDEIAEVMSLPLNTVKTTLYRGLKKLKDHLGEDKSNGK